MGNHGWLVVAGGGASQLYDAASWTSNAEVGAIGVAVPVGSQGIVELDVVAPSVATQTPVSEVLALTDGTAQVGTVQLAVTVTPDGDENLSGDSDDTTDGEVSGGCTAGGGPAGWRSRPSCWCCAAAALDDGDTWPAPGAVIGGRGRHCATVNCLEIVALPARAVTISGPFTFGCTTMQPSWAMLGCAGPLLDVNDHGAWTCWSPSHASKQISASAVVAR